MKVVAAIAAGLLAASAPIATEVTAPGPDGALKGTMVDAGRGRPVVLIVPGSGPTDRDGNNPLGVAASTYRLLAEGLAARGVSSVRVDKRGMFGSAAAVPDANAVTVADYARDVHAWIDAIRGRAGARCVWVLGHSEGGLVALAAAARPTGLCGLVLVSTPGRPAGALLREQLRANPANAPLVPQAEAAIAALEKDESVDPAALHPALAPLFAAPVQGFLRSLFAVDPAALARAYRGPVLIVQGGRDLQVPKADARALAAADPRAKLVVVEGANHVLKAVGSHDRTANLATYADPALPLADGIVGPIADFVGG